jgi:hypothetical protein
MRGVRSGADRNEEAMLGGKPGRAYLYGGWHPGGAGKTRWAGLHGTKAAAFFPLILI